MAILSHFNYRKRVKRNGEEQFRELMRGLEGQIKETTIKVASANQKGKKQLEKPSFECKSYFCTVAVILLSHALRLSFHFYLPPMEKHSVTLWLSNLRVKNVRDCVQQTNRCVHMSRCTLVLSLLVKSIIFMQSGDMGCFFGKTYH